MEQSFLVQTNELHKHIKAQGQDATVDGILKAIRSRFQIVGEYGTGQNGVVNGLEDQWLWLRDGAFFRVDRTYDRFGDMESRFDAISIGHLRSTVGLEIIAENHFRKGQDTERTLYTVEPGQEPGFFQYIEQIEEKMERPLERDELLEFWQRIGTPSSSSAFCILSDALQQDTLVQEECLASIYRECEWLYRSLKVEYNQSPSDWDASLPADAAHFFIQKLPARARDSGLAAVIPDNEVIKRGYSYLAATIGKLEPVHTLITQYSQWEATIREEFRIRESISMQKEIQATQYQYDLEKDDLGYLESCLKEDKGKRNEIAKRHYSLFDRLFRPKRYQQERERNEQDLAQCDTIIQKRESEIADRERSLHSLQRCVCWLEERLDPGAGWYESEEKFDTALIQAQEGVENNRELYIHCKMLREIEITVEKDRAPPGVAGPTL